MKHNVVVGIVGALLALVSLLMGLFVGADALRTELPWMIAIVPMVLVGSLLVLRVPENRISWILFGIVVASSLTDAVLVGLGQSMSGVAPSAWLNAIAVGVNTAAISLLPLLLVLFPNGLLPTSRWKPVAGFIIVNAIWGGTVALMTGGWGGDVGQAPELSPLFEVTAGFTGVGATLHTSLLGVGLAAALVSLATRYRRGTREDRQQLKWLLVAVAFFLIALVVTGGAGGLWQTILLATGLALIPIAIGIAVLRYRLYEVDVVISKSITYLGLAAVVTALYAAIVAVPILMLRATDVDFGEGGLTLPFVATVVVAVVFEPLRVRMQRWANRLVYGERATPHEVLSTVTASLAGADANGDDLARLIGQGTGALSAVIWRSRGGTLVPAGSWPREAEPEPMPKDQLEEYEAQALIVHQDEPLGAVTLSKERSDPVTPADRELLENVAAAAGLMLRNGQLNRQLEERAAEVRESRQRMITARDAERHRLERDLHDGAQQQVVALKVKLGLAKTLAEREGAEQLAATIASLSDETQEAVDAMRAVAHGIYPPLLEAEGLATALGSLQRSAPISVTMGNGELGRYDHRIEQTAYFFVSESVDRAHMAGARSVHVAIDEANGLLGITLDHDGRSTVEDVGAIADRIEAYGGTATTEVSSTGRSRTVVAIPATNQSRP